MLYGYTFTLTKRVALYGVVNSYYDIIGYEETYESLYVDQTEADRLLLKAMSTVYGEHKVNGNELTKYRGN